MTEQRLRVWHVPQAPCPSFHVYVRTLSEAVKIMRILAEYDEFQFKNKIKGDRTNAQGLEVFEDGVWVEWYSEDGRDIEELYQDEMERREMQ